MKEKIKLEGDNNELINNFILYCGIIITATIAIFLLILAIFIIFYTIKAVKKELKKQVEVDGK